MVRQVVGIVGVLLLGAAYAFAEPYEVAYTAPECEACAADEGLPGPFPEDQGWVKFAGASDIVQRTIQNGTLVLEAHEMGDFETYSGEMNNTLNPGPGEFLYIEWRMMVIAESTLGDTITTIALDDFDGDTTLSLGVDRVCDFPMGCVEYEVGMPHTFLLCSLNLLDYDLFVDGRHALTGVFKVPTSLNSFVNWGKGSSSSFSTSEWDFFRFGAAVLGDINTDGKINLLDFATFARCFGASVNSPPGSCTDQEAALSDLDGSGLIDLGDFATLAVNFGG